MDGLIESLTGMVGVSPERLAQWFLLLSFALPYLIALVQQPAWSKAVRARVTLGICGLAAFGVLYAEGALTLGNWLAGATGIFALTATFYKHFAKLNGAGALEGASTDALLRAAGGVPASTATPENPPAGEDAGLPRLSAPDLGPTAALLEELKARAAANEGAQEPAQEPDEESPDVLVARYKATIQRG